MLQDKVLNAALCMSRQCWEQGILAQALYEIGDFSRLRIVIRDMILRQSSDGRLCNVENTPAVTDSAFCIPAVYGMALQDENEMFFSAARKNVDFLLYEAAGAKDRTLYHILNTSQIWADSAAFLPYALALTGHQEAGMQQMNGICNRLYCKESGLYLHMWDESSMTYKRPLAWGVGNGWVLTGLLRLLLVLDNEYEKEKRHYLMSFQTLLDNMLSFRQKEHLLHDILDDMNSFEESESSVMVAYAVYKAVQHGLIDKKYCREADEIRLLVYQKIDESGLIMDSAGSPGFVSPGTSTECQAIFLMMEKAYDDLKNAYELKTPV